MTADAGQARRRRLAIVGLVLFAVLYVGLLVLYAVAGKTKEVQAEIPADGVRVVLEANDVDGEGQRMLLDVDLDPSDSLLRRGRAHADRAGDGHHRSRRAASREVTFAAGQVPAIVQVPLVLDGDIRDWPFDRYDVDFVVGRLRRAGR